MFPRTIFPSMIFPSQVFPPAQASANASVPVVRNPKAFFVTGNGGAITSTGGSGSLNTGGSAEVVQ